MNGNRDRRLERKDLWLPVHLDSLVRRQVPCWQGLIGVLEPLLIVTKRVSPGSGLLGSDLINKIYIPGQINRVSDQ